jgi:hypothetical protein
MKTGAYVLYVVLLVACADNPARNDTYQYDYIFLKKHTDGIELKDAEGLSRILLSAKHQGRVFTSTSQGLKGISYGWINYPLIESKDIQKHINPVGGEERFWLGPEGGQYALYFEAGKPFTFDHWQVPPIIDTEPFTVIEQSDSSVTFTKDAKLTNYSRTKFEISIDRTITLLPRKEIEHQLKTQIPKSVHSVAYRSENKITNTGSEDWRKENGLLSIWLLGMFIPSDQTMAIIPFKPTPAAKEMITTNYFGAIPEERLTIRDSVLYFSCDGRYRSKIGLAPAIAKPLAASYDFHRHVLTLVFFNVQPGLPYVNSKWEMQELPYRGDVINAYNDGPLADGTQMGPFYELESSSPALELKSGESGYHNQVTVHLEGSFDDLNKLTIELLGVNLNDIKKK